MLASEYRIYFFCSVNINWNWNHRKVMKIGLSPLESATRSKPKAQECKVGHVQLSNGSANSRPRRWQFSTPFSRKKLQEREQLLAETMSCKGLSFGGSWDSLIKLYLIWKVSANPLPPTAMCGKPLDSWESSFWKDFPRRISVLWDIPLSFVWLFF